MAPLSPEARGAITQRRFVVDGEIKAMEALPRVGKSGGRSGVRFGGQGKEEHFFPSHY
jgi:hypothetical protein